jgi:hypothetical protein
MLGSPPSATRTGCGQEGFGSSEEDSGCQSKEIKKTAEGCLRLLPKPILFQWPTRLAVGLGLKEPTLAADATYTPLMVPPLSLLGDSALVTCLNLG